MNESLRIETMTQKDCKGVSVIEQECFSTPWSLESIEETLQFDTHQFLVAKIEEKIVGYMGMILTLEEADVTNVAVLPDYRHKGIGEALVNESLKRAKELGVETVFLEVRESNLGAIHLYKKLRFVPISVRKNYYRDPLEHAVIMSADLSTIKE